MSSPTPRRRRPGVAIALPQLVALALSLAACSSSKATTPLPTTVPPTVCATTAGEAARIVKVTVDDANGKSGGLFSQAPPGLVAGTVRIEVTTDSGNVQPSDVLLAREGTTVASVLGVPPGSVCAIDVTLSAGHYEVHETGRTIAFDVAP